MSYSLYLNFVLVEWFLAELWLLNLYFLFVQIVSCPEIYLTFFDILTWYLVCGYIDELQLEFRFGRMIFGWVMALELVFYVQILSSPDVFSRLLRYWLDIWYVAISRWDTGGSWMIFVFFVCSNCKLSGDLFDVLWYIDLIFGMWLYLDELQFKLEFRSGRMMFGWVMALELVFYVQILICPDFFLRPLRYWLDIWYVAISRWVTVYIWTSFWSNDFWLSYGPWTCIFCLFKL